MKRGDRAGRVTRCCAPAGTTRIRPGTAVRYARLFKALADPTRLEILGLLAAASSPLCVCEIEAAFDLTQPTISHHLRALRESGLVRTARRGLWIYYAIEHGALAAAMELGAVLAPLADREERRRDHERHGRGQDPRCGA